MPLLLLILFIGVPLGELALLLWIADKTHWAFPLALVVFTGVLGVTLLRLQGVMTMRRVQRSFQGSDEPPTDPLIDAGLMLFAAGLLLTPGVLTDVLGLSLLFPPTRLLWRHAVKRWGRGRFQVVRWDAAKPQDDDNVIDGEVVD